MEKQWTLYVLECRDGSLYTGITDDLERRLKAHRSGKGAKYTRGRGPLKLRYREELPDHSAALKREIAIKRLSRSEKLEMMHKFEKESGDGLAIFDEKVYTVKEGEDKYMESVTSLSKEEERKT